MCAHTGRPQAFMINSSDTSSSKDICSLTGYPAMSPSNLGSSVTTSEIGTEVIRWSRPQLRDCPVLISNHRCSENYDHQFHGYPYGSTEAVPTKWLLPAEAWPVPSARPKEFMFHAEVIAPRWFQDLLTLPLEGNALQEARFPNFSISFVPHPPSSLLPTLLELVLPVFAL